MELNPYYLDKVIEAKVTAARGEGHLQGLYDEHERIIKRMESYFELSKFSEDVEGGESNPEWDRGYQAALAIAKRL